VYDCTAPFPGIIAHLGKMGAGALRKNDAVHASIDVQKRKEIQNNHTATHILHWALQKVLGPHIKQAGSLVSDKRLRFDFSHHKAIGAEELRTIENLINEKIRSDLPVQIYELSYNEAQKREDIKQFFGEKYGDKVRVIDIDFSKELCGGTHTPRVGTIGLFKIVKESSIAAGVRRIEAISGRYAELWVEQEEDLLQNLALQLKAPTQMIPEKLQMLIDENKLLTQELKSWRKGELKELLEKCLSHKEQAGSIALIAKEVVVSAEDLNDFAQELI
jgi:alanyl-tRNA synthetase